MSENNFLAENAEIPIIKGKNEFLCEEIEGSKYKGVHYRMTGEEEILNKCEHGVLKPLIIKKARHEQETIVQATSDNELTFIDVFNLQLPPSPTMPSSVSSSSATEINDEIVSHNMQGPKVLEDISVNLCRTEAQEYCEAVLRMIRPRKSLTEKDPPPSKNQNNGIEESNVSRSSLSSNISLENSMKGDEKNRISSPVKKRPKSEETGEENMSHNGNTDEISEILNQSQETKEITHLILKNKELMKQSREINTRIDELKRNSDSQREAIKSFQQKLKIHNPEHSTDDGENEGDKTKPFISTSLIKLPEQLDGHALDELVKYPDMRRSCNGVVKLFWSEEERKHLYNLVPKAKKGIGRKIEICEIDAIINILTKISRIKEEEKIIVEAGWKSLVKSWIGYKLNSDRDKKKPQMEKRLLPKNKKK